MKKRKSLLVIFLSICLLVQYGEVVCHAQNRENAPKESELYAKAAVLMDADSGRILYAKNETNAMANASTTKILTCILALEYSQPDAVVEASARAASAPKVHLGMKAGQHFYMQDMLYALMLESYNDCAVVIAEHIAGSVEDFAVLMNEKAKEIGCQDTYFITPNGLDGTDKNGFHHTTAADLALMMRYCIMKSEQKEAFRTITAARNYSFCEIDSGRQYQVTNHNAFLDMMSGAFSGKTGFTGNAGYCYVGALTRDDRTYIVALLACGWPNNRTYKWFDSKKLMQYGIENFEMVNLSEIEIEEGKITRIPVNNGQTEEIGETAYAEIRIGEGIGEEKILLAKEEELKIIYEVKDLLEAPVKKGSVAGTISIKAGEQVLRQYHVIVRDSVKKINFTWCFREAVELFLKGI